MSGPVVLLFGGQSGERRVSVASAQNVVALLGESAQPCFVAPDGRVYACTHAELAAHPSPFEQDFLPAGAPRFATLPAALDHAREWAGADAVFFLGFHGGAGEDGTVQRWLEQRGLPFTGSDSSASARAFDKSVAKAVAAGLDVPVADSLMLPADDPIAVRAGLEELLAAHGRVVAKPVADGSSVGLFHVRSPAEIEPTVASIAARTGTAYLAEALVAGRELTVGVVDDEHGRTRALPPSEVRFEPGRVFDFEGKYLGRGTIEITPAEVSPAITAAAQQIAITVHQGLGCRGYSRTDVIVTDAGRVVFLEINTLPGLTKASFLPQQLAAEGTDVRDFLRSQITLARRRAS